MTVRCAQCNAKLANNEVYHHRGKVFCEECYMMVLQRPKTCDVLATVFAKNHREKAGQTGTEGLLDIQKNIYNYIKEKGKTTREEIIEALNIPEWELEKHIAILRHCELVKGRKEGNQVFLVLFDA
ncbi:MAG: hypothetical protein AVO34_11155 [Firmicutes bacterium ML8_F2]|jgi:late competence protein required for DNA uptake (superfamily II DNA/RNA helicase)|nr:MAG: hypothetical protein AVO34_11155 [Firmicutes bacterium ML8_F2]